MSNQKQQVDYQKLILVHYNQIDKNIRTEQYGYKEFIKYYLSGCVEAIYKILIEDQYGEIFREIYNFINKELNQKLDQVNIQINQRQPIKGHIDLEQQVELNKQIEKTNCLQTFHSQNNNNDNYTQHQKEIQINKQISQQAQQKIQYYVYEDLNNLMEVLADVKQTLKNFDSQSDHPYIPIAVNRLIQQVNLSNMVHFDCTQRYKNKDEEYFYQKEKDNAQKLYIQLLNDMQLTYFKELDFPLSNYEQNFGQVNQMKQLSLLKTAGEGQFNQTVVQQVFGGIQHVDQKKSQIKKGQYKQLEYKQIKDNINTILIFLGREN